VFYPAAEGDPTYPVKFLCGLCAFAIFAINVCGIGMDQKNSGLPRWFEEINAKEAKPQRTQRVSDKSYKLGS
jgi:hypothetical protein